MRLVKRVLKRVLYPIYELRLFKRLDLSASPKHVGVILDGNRRWAKANLASSKSGHSAGARKVIDFLSWCEELEIIAETVDALSKFGRWKLHVVGATDLLPEWLSTRLEEAVAKSPEREKLIVNLAIGYGGRREITDAVRRLLKENLSKGETLESAIDKMSMDEISRHLYTAGQPDPDLVIRTSGEQRLSGFLLWQSAHSEFYFCEAFWPDFRRLDFLRALRAYAQRNRRFGK
ncbi:MAG: di-trans,poly-cis-decaprenylcistransferase [Actinobacteria bacterium]|uniref:Isoprenyl transferase n=1 Tax=Candidatus Fonsibacter lacus TaxID=2576439 RepID=A0A965GCI0_9PROT|nr:di-trans,poly-cis-decaprenylcistransferase [Candidatus Fonsibacter lacus]